jgi:hypothetical protein
MRGRIYILVTFIFSKISGGYEAHRLAVGLVFRHKLSQNQIDAPRSAVPVVQQVAAAILLLLVACPVGLGILCKATCN